MGLTLGLVLVVEDDGDFRALLREVLHDHDFSVVEATTGAQAKDMIELHDPDLVLLDLGLPDVSGLDVLTDLTCQSARPVIVLSGRTGEADTVVGLDLGADDYITKPFSERELVSHLKAALRRTRRQHTRPALVFDELRVEEDTRDVTADGSHVRLTPKAFDLLTFLAHSPRRVFDRDQLLQHVWDRRRIGRTATQLQNTYIDCVASWTPRIGPAGLRQSAASATGSHRNLQSTDDDRDCRRALPRRDLESAFGIAQVDLTGCVVAVCDQFCAMVGLSPEAIVGQTMP